MPAFDPARLRELSGGDQAFEQELVGSYLASTRQSLERLAQALREQNRSALEAAAHRLKGTNSNLGAEHLAAQAESLLRSLRGAEPLDALEPRVQRIVDEHAALAAELRARWPA